MHDQEPTYDVALSFLYEDLALAQALHDELSKGLNVFFFPRNQEELAGSDGLESMQKPFRSQSRLNVVLYRQGWGKTPWTGVEQAAIKDSCLATSFQSIFFFVIEPTSEIPTWLPNTHVRFNFVDFPLDQAIRAINARVLERGGHSTEMPPARKAARLQAEYEYQRDRRLISSQDGMQKIQQNVELLFAKISGGIEDVNAESDLNVECRITSQFQSGGPYCVLGIPGLGMSIRWVKPFSYTLDEAHLIVRELNEDPTTPLNQIRRQLPNVLREEKYLPDISRDRKYVWRPMRGGEEMITSEALAAKLIFQLLDLVERDRAGKVKRQGW